MYHLELITEFLMEQPLLGLLKNGKAILKIQLILFFK